MTSALPTGCVIALLGAEGNAKARLAEALTQRLAGRGMAATVLVAPASTASFDEDDIAAYRACARILLIAPALPSAADDALRKALADARLSFAVVHGEGPDRLANAWNAIDTLAEPEGGAQAARDREGTWSWSCEKCSDPVCEHRLFSDLVAKRS